MKIALMVLGLVMSYQASAANTHVPAGDIYGIHLFFNETEAVDLLTIDYTQSIPVGKMHVPNDFDATVRNLLITDTKISFDLDVPKNSSRPVEMVFHYDGTFFDDSHSQVAGFVTILNGKDFVASFTAFRRP